MSRFARDCLFRMTTVVRRLETLLGPDTCKFTFLIFIARQNIVSLNTKFESRLGSAGGSSLRTRHCWVSLQDVISLYCLVLVLLLSLCFHYFLPPVFFEAIVPVFNYLGKILI